MGFLNESCLQKTRLTDSLHIRPINYAIISTPQSSGAIVMSNFSLNHKVPPVEEYCTVSSSARESQQCNSDCHGPDRIFRNCIRRSELAELTTAPFLHCLPRTGLYTPDGI